MKTEMQNQSATISILSGGTSEFWLIRGQLSMSSYKWKHFYSWTYLQMGHPDHHTYWRKGLIFPNIGKSWDLFKKENIWFVLSELFLKPNHPFKEQNYCLSMKAKTIKLYCLMVNFKTAVLDNYNTNMSNYLLLVRQYS